MNYSKVNTSVSLTLGSTVKCCPANYSTLTVGFRGRNYLSCMRVQIHISTDVCGGHMSLLSNFDHTQGKPSGETSQCLAHGDQCG